MSTATRLLVLGAIRIMQPVHGYDVRRELVSWRIGDVSNVKPGSIYGAIRTLEKDGCIAVHARESEDSRPERTTYVTTGEGEKEFELLLRQAWWTVQQPVEPLIPALSMLPFMPRDELIAALQARFRTLLGQIESLTFQRRQIKAGATGADGEIPEHVRETLDYLDAKFRAELEWTKKLEKRLRAGQYSFSGEGGFPVPSAGRGLTRGS